MNEKRIKFFFILRLFYDFRILFRDVDVMDDEQKGSPVAACQSFYDTLLSKQKILWGWLLNLLRFFDPFDDDERLYDLSEDYSKGSDNFVCVLRVSDLFSIKRRNFPRLWMRLTWPRAIFYAIFLLYLNYCHFFGRHRDSQDTHRNTIINVIIHTLSSLVVACSSFWLML